MAHKTSIGRKASEEARSHASALAGVYGPIIPKESALALLAAWERFVETGWLPSPTGESSMEGRRASDEAREAAQKLLDAYGPAILSPSGNFCVNPEEDEEDRVVVSAEQAAYALFEAMVRLATTGWLVHTEVKLEKFIIREYFYKVIQPEDRAKTAALETLREKYPRSIRDLERMVGKKKS